jgi:hypothetical protein
MPRGRGGARDGKIGKAYQNRTDLQGQNVVAAQPQNQPGQKMKAQAASGQAYGAAKAQLDSQKALSIQNTGTPVETTQGAPIKRAPLTALNAPGDPNQSLFNGMDNIPGGGGSEALIPQMDQQLSMTALGLLDSLGDNVSPQVTMIKNYLRAQANNGIMQ